jgi:hypothetical protein
MDWPLKRSRNQVPWGMGQSPMALLKKIFAALKMKIYQKYVLNLA